MCSSPDLPPPVVERKPAKKKPPQRVGEDLQERRRREREGFRGPGPAPRSGGESLSKVLSKPAAVEGKRLLGD